MEYIERIIQYMGKNSAKISIKQVDHLREPFRISSSKFIRDFKNITGSTPRDWLITKKMDLAFNFKSEDPTLTIKEAVDKIGWDLTERQFSEIYQMHHGSTFGGKAIRSHSNFGFPLFNGIGIEPEDEFFFSAGKEELEEIVFRMLIMTGEYTVEPKGELSRLVKLNIEGSCFRFPFPTFEKDLIFAVFFNPGNSSRLDLSMAITRLGQSDLCYAPKDKGVYLDLIQNVAINQDKHIKVGILESIANWDELVSSNGSFTDGDYVVRTYNADVLPKINRDAGIFKYSKTSYEEIALGLIEEYEQLLCSLNLNSKDIKMYCSHVRERNEEAMLSMLRMFIGSSERRLLPEKLDLIVQLTECPFIDDIRFSEYRFGMEKDLILQIIERLPYTVIPNLIVKYFRAYVTVSDDIEYHGVNVMSEILREYSIS